MNSVVQWWRNSNPDDSRTDDEITLDLAGKFPNEFQTYPDALQDFNRIRADLLRDQATVVDKVKQGVGSLVRGAADVIASGVEGVGTFSAGAGKKLEDVAPIFEMGEGNRPIEERPAYTLTQKIGGGIRAIGEKISPEPVEGLEDSFLATKLPNAVGSALGFMAGGAVGKAVKIPEMVGIGGFGAMSSGASAWKEAKAAGASEDDAYKVFLLNAGVGTSEVIPLSRMLKRLDGISGKAFTKMLVEAGKESFEESAQEAAQQFAQNYIAKKYYDKDRDLLNELGDNAAAGGITGAMFSLITNAIGAKLGKGHQTEAEPEAKPTGPQVAPAQPKAKSETTVDVTSGYASDEDKKLVDELVEKEKAGDDASNPVMVALSAAVGERIRQTPALGRYYAEQRKAGETETITPKESGNVASTHELVQGLIDEATQRFETRRQEIADEEAAKQRQDELQSAAATAIDEAKPTASVLDMARRMAVEGPVTTEEAESGDVRYSQRPQPWQQTKWEFGRFERGGYDSTTSRRHRRLLAEAISRGERIPPEVLADYPEFQLDTNPEPKAWELTPEEYSTDPTGRRVHGKLVEAAVMGGKPVPERILAFYPDLAESVTANRQRIAERAKAEAEKLSLKQQRGEERALKLKSQAGPPPSSPWKILQVNPSTVSDQVAFGEAATVTADAGPGKKAAAAFTETSSPVELYKDSKADASNRTYSRKLAVLLSPDRTHVVVGTAYRNASGGKLNDMVTVYDAYGKPKAFRFDSLTSDGWKLVASLKTTRPTKGYVATHSAEEWESAATDLRGQAAAARATAAAVEEQLLAGGNATVVTADGGRSQLRDAQGSDVDYSAVEEAAETVHAVEGFEDAHAEAIFDALTDISDDEFENEFVDAVSTSRRAVGAIEVALRSVVEQSGSDVETAYRALRSLIYESFKGNRQSKTGFEKALSASLNPSGIGAVASGGTQSSVHRETSQADAVTIAAQETRLNPTDAQKESGRYPKGVVTLDGLDVVIETPQGAERTSKAGQPKWSVVLPVHYGYVKGTEGHDGDEVDVFIGEHPESTRVWVIDQINPKTNKFDEHKAMIGFDSKEHALAAYDASFSDNSGPSRRGAVTEMEKQEFVDWVNEGGGENGALAYEVRSSTESAPSGSTSLDSFVRDNNLRLPRPYDTWRMLEHPVVGGIQGLPDMRGIAVASNGMMVAIQTDVGVRYGHLAHFIKDRGASDDLDSEIAEARHTRFRDYTAPFSRNDQTISALFQSALESAAVNGIRVSVLQAKVIEEGRYTKRHRAVMLTIADAINPSTDNLVLAFHEIAHDVFAHLPISQLDSIQRAISSLSAPEGFNPKISAAIQGEERERVAAEEALVERAARRLVEDGFDPAEARGVVQRLIRALAELYHRAVMAIQQALLGQATAIQAQAYFENRLRAFLARDISPMSVTSFLGGPKPTAEQQAALFPAVVGDGGLPARFDYETGQMVSGEVLPETLAAMEFNQEGVRHSFRGTAGHKASDPALISRDLNSPLKVAEDVAAYNALDEMYRAAFDAFTTTGLNTSRLTYEDWAATGNFVKVDALPLEKIALRNKWLVAEGFTPVPADTIIGDLTAPSSQMQAADKALRYGWSLRAVLSERRKAAESALKQLPQRLERSSQRVREMQKRYDDLDFQFATAKQELSEIHHEFSGDLKNIGAGARRVGTLTQVIAQLDGRIGDPARLSKEYVAVIERLYRKFTGDTEGKFIDLLDNVAKLGIDWSTITAPEATKAIAYVLAPGDPNLHRLENRALAAIAVSYAKRNADVMEFLQLRRERNFEERRRLNEILELAVSDSRNAIAEARALSRKLPSLAVTAERLLNRLEEVKIENRALLDELQRAKVFAEFHTAMLPGLNKQLARLEARIGASLQSWEPTNNAEYFVAPSVSAKAEEVIESKRVFKLTSNGSITGEVREHIRRNREWLNKVPDDQRGAVWNTVSRMTDKLQMVDANFKHEAIKGSVINKLLGSIEAKLEYVGLPSSRAAAQRIRIANAERHAHQADADNLGVQFMAEESRAMKALGLSGIGTKRFQRLYFHAALDFAEKNPDLLAEHKDHTEAFNALLLRLRKFFETDPDTQAAIQRPGAWTALVAYYRAANKAMEFVNTARKKLGLKILEEGPDGFRIFREPIGATFFTALRRLNENAIRMYHEMRTLGWTEPFNPAALAKAYADDPASFRRIIALRFDRNVWREFVTPLTERQGRTAFYAPTRADGITPLALRHHVAAAAATSRGDVVAFAESLYELSHTRDTAQTKADFVGATLASFQAFFDAIHTTQARFDDAVQHGMPTPPRLMQDARISEEWPGEWLDYATYDRHDMGRMIHLMVAHASYGRNLEAIRKDFATAQAELRSLTTVFQGIIERVQVENPGRARSAMNALVRTAVEKNGHNWTAISNAENNLAIVTSQASQFESLMRSQSGLVLELRWFSELIGTLAGMTVQGPGTALLDAYSIVGQPFSKLGIGATAFKTLAATGKSLVSEGFGTLAQVFHKQIKWNAEKNARRVSNGIFDPDARRRIRDVTVAVLNDTTMDAMNPVTKNIVKGSRLLRSAISAGVGKSGESAINSYVTFKPHAVFSQAALTEQFAAIDGWISTFEDMVERAVSYFQSPLNVADAENPAFQFTNPDQLGYGKKFFGLLNDERAFEYLTNALNRYGMSLEQAARDTIERRRGNPHAAPLTDAQFVIMASLVQNEVTLDSNPTTRPASFFTNPVLHLSNPLLGWSIAKSHDVWENFRRPNGGASMSAFLTGTKAYLALVPIGLAFALLRDEYDEELLGKKGNRPPANSLPGLADAMGRVGAFGVFGDIGNSLLNRDTERPFTVDNRVFFISGIVAASRALSAWSRQGDADYATVYRPLVAALGGSGYLQYAQILNRAFSPDNTEARITARINANNYLRVAGRELKLKLRERELEPSSNPVKLYVGQMVLAAFANDHNVFNQAYRNAKVAAASAGKADPPKYVAEVFGARHPLRSVFVSMPTQEQYSGLLGTLNDDGRQAVVGAVAKFEHYAGELGVTFKLKRDAGALMKLPTLPRTATLDDFRRLAVNYGSEF